MVFHHNTGYMDNKIKTDKNNKKIDMTKIQIHSDCKTVSLVLYMEWFRWRRGVRQVWAALHLKPLCWLSGAAVWK